MATTNLNSKAKALAQAILAAAQPQEDVIPNGWISNVELQNEWGCGKSGVHKRLKKAGDRIERKIFRVRFPYGIRCVDYYRLK